MQAYEEGKLNELMFKLTGIADDFEKIITDTMERGDEQKVKALYNNFTWHIPRGEYLKNSELFAQFKSLIQEIASRTGIYIDIAEEFGVIDENDINLIKQNKGKDPNEYPGDINADGKIDDNDVTAAEEIAANQLASFLLSAKAKIENDPFDIYVMVANDGINEEGFVCNVNVVPTGEDMGDITLHTNNGKKRLGAQTLVRFLLDNCATVEDAIVKLADRDIYCPNAEGLFQQEFHWMCADKNGKSMIVELRYREEDAIKTGLTFVMTEEDYVALENKADVDALVEKGIVHIVFKAGNIMTNFNVALMTKDYPTYEDDDQIQEYPAGTERYNYMRNAVESVASAADMKAMMKGIRYSQAYKRDLTVDDKLNQDFLLSEFVGYWPGTTTDPKDSWGNVNDINMNYDYVKAAHNSEEAIDSDLALFLGNLKAYWATLHDENDRPLTRPHTFWQTTHASTYDMNAKKLFINTREYYGENEGYTFDFDSEWPEDREFVKLDDYTFKAMIADYDFEQMQKDMMPIYLPGGKCSSAFNKDAMAYGRNLDWTETTELCTIAYIPAKEGRYASINVLDTCQQISDATPDKPATVVFKENGDIDATGYFGQAVISDEFAKEGDTITITAEPFEGYEFVKWSDGKKNAVRKEIVTSDKEYIAIFKKK